MKSKLLWGTLFLSLAVAFGAYFLFREPPRERLLRPLPVIGQLPPFQLTDQAGRTITLASLAGHPWVADFIFTSCAGTCPQMTARMAGLRKKLPGVRLVSFSVDPARDTPQVLAAYAARYGADARRWVFLTGKPEEVTALVTQGFRLSRAEGTDPREPIIHSVRFVLVDAAGAIRGYYDSTDPEHMERLLQDAGTVLRNP